MDLLQALTELPLVLQRIEVALKANEKIILQMQEELTNCRLFEQEAAQYLHVHRDTLYRYRLAGLPYEKVGRIISYRRKDLDEWRERGRTQHVDIK